MRKAHGGDIYSNIGIDFSANISPLGVPESVLSAVENSLESITQYPDPECRQLREKIAAKHNVLSDFVICGNGAAEIIYNVVFAVMPKKALVLSPTFSEYERALRAVKADISCFYLTSENSFDLTSDILDYINPEIDILFICNPNNPTGRLCDNALVLEILEKCRKCGVLLVIDECFLNFTQNGKSLVSCVNEYENLLILNAFTKLYAMPSLRLGYGISSNKGLLEKMLFIRQPWTVSGVAQAAGLAALEETGLEQKTAAFVADEREYLLNALNKLGFCAINSSTNFILFKANKGLDEKLLKKGFIIRNCNNFTGLCDGWYRVAVKTHDENVQLILALSQIVGVQNG